MLTERKGNIIDNSDIEELIPKNRKTKAFWAIVMLLLIYGLFEWALEILSMWFVGLFITSLLIFLFLCFQSLTETVAISSKEVKYSTISKKLECDWKDILKIKVETYKQRSEQTGLIINSTTNYITHTSKGTFNLEEGKNWAGMHLF